MKTIVKLILIMLVVLSSCTSKKVAYDPYYSLGPKGVSKKFIQEDSIPFTKVAEVEDLENIKTELDKKNSVRSRDTSPKESTISKLNFSGFKAPKPLSSESPTKIEEPKFKEVQPALKKTDSMELWGDLFKVLEVLFYVMVIAGILGWLMDMADLIEE